MTEKTAKTGPGLTRIILVLSLGANLLIAGAFLGAQLSGGPPPKDNDRRAGEMSLGPYGRALSQDGRKEIREAIAARRAWFQGSRQQMRQLGQEMAAAMTAEPFDLSSVEDVLTRQASVQNAVQAEGRSLLLSRIEAMTPEQRAAFAERLAKGIDRSKRKEKP